MGQNLHNTIILPHTSTNIECALTLVRLAGFDVVKNAQILAYDILYRLQKPSVAMKLVNAEQAKKHGTLVFFRLIELMRGSMVKEFNVNLLCDIHYTLFLNIFKNAGTLRKKDIVKENSCCISFKLLKTSLKSALRQLDRGRAKLMTRAEAAAALCHFCRELLVLSPFYEGSELAMNVMLWQFCATCGLNLDYSRCREEIQAAQKLCLMSDDVGGLYECYIKSLTHFKPAVRKKPMLSLPAPLPKKQKHQIQAQRKHKLSQLTKKTKKKKSI